MPRVKIPRAGRALKLLWQGPVSNPHAPAKTIAVRKFATAHGSLAQQKVSASGSQLSDCRNRKSPVSGGGVRVFTTDRVPTFAAAPYLKLLKSDLQVDGLAVAPAQPSLSLPSPTFAARPVWEGPSLASTLESPQSRRQAAVRAKLAHTPLYVYSQLQGGRGVHKHSARATSSAAAAAKAGKVGARESEALKWFGGLNSSRANTSRLSVKPVKPRALRKSM